MLLNIGNNGYVNEEKILAIIPYDSSRIKSEVAYKKKISINERRSDFFDTTKGKKINSVIILETGVYVVSSISANALNNRLLRRKK